MANADISVIIPVYNSGAYLRESVDSVLMQKCDPSYEVVVVDDRSSDRETLDILDELRRQGDPIRVVGNRGNRGVGGCKNAGLRAAEGEWALWLDSDDYWSGESSLQTLWELTLREPDADWVSCTYDVLNHDGSFSAPYSVQIEALKPAFDQGKTVRLRKPFAELIGNAALQTGVVLIRKPLLDEIGGFEEQLKVGQDWYLWMVTASMTDLVFSPQSIMHYRRHDQAVGRNPELQYIWAPRKFRLAYANPRFHSVKRQIRWRLIAEYRIQSNAAKGNNMPGLAMKLAFLSWLWGPNDVRQLGQALTRTWDYLRSFCCPLRQPAG